MAARGIRLYAAKKQTLIDPMFYANKEKEIPSLHLKDMAQNKLTYHQMLAMHPKTDKEDLRLRGIKAIESVEGGNTLSQLNRMGVDMTVKMAKESRTFNANVVDVLKDRQKSSFLPVQKVQMLKEQVGG